MPPPEPNMLAGMLAEVHRLDPTLDLRPGTQLRSAVEVIARSGQVSGLNLDRQLREQSLERLLFETPATPPDLRTFGRALEDLSRAALAAGTAPRELQRALAAMTRVELPRLELPQVRLNPEEAARLSRAAAEIMAQEDREIFQRLDAIAAEGFEPMYTSTWRMEELPGEARVNPRAVERLRGDPEPGARELRFMSSELPGRFVNMPEFEMHANPTVRIDDIRRRRFAITNPCGEQDLGSTGSCDLTLEQMQEIAIVMRRTAWERLLDEELPF